MPIVDGICDNLRMSEEDRTLEAEAERAAKMMDAVAAFLEYAGGSEIRHWRT